MSVILADIGHSLREAFLMLWATWWALVLGFGLSGAVQAFVSRDAMRRRLGDHRPASLTRAALYGSASSSCSYAASAMARSLVAGGADFVAAMVFMVASTNLVIELGLVLLVLLGWEFLAAQLVGGLVMIGLLGVLGGLWFRGRALAEAARRVAADTEAEHPTPTDGASGPDRSAIRTWAGWSNAAAYTMSDLAMLRMELLVGFVAAGFLTELIPARVWSDFFVTGHGAWTTLENALVGPLVAVISFVCSIGNVPLAAALWGGGISFGGVVAFVFADLITLPLLAIYRKQYGWRMAGRILMLFWAVMAAAGLVTEGVFRALGWIPRPARGPVTAEGIHWGATTVLDIIAVVLLSGLYLLYRRRARLGGGVGYATDPVCGMQVEIAHAPAQVDGDGPTAYFCSEHCADRFRAERFRAERFRRDSCPGGVRTS